MEEDFIVLYHITSISFHSSNKKTTIEMSHPHTYNRHITPTFSANMGFETEQFCCETKMIGIFQFLVVQNRFSALF